jgi:hypothetical protein
MDSSFFWGHLYIFASIGGFKMIVDKYVNYERKFMWQLCGWGRVDICMTFHKRAFDFLYHCTLM